MQLQTHWGHILTKVEHVILICTSFGHYAVLWSIFGLHMSRNFLPDRHYFSATFLLNYLLCFTKEYLIGCFWEYTWCVLLRRKRGLKSRAKLCLYISIFSSPLIFISWNHVVWVTQLCLCLWLQRASQLSRKHLKGLWGSCWLGLLGFSLDMPFFLLMNCWKTGPP